MEVGFVLNGVACYGLVSDFIKGIGSVGDEFSEEDFLVGVEGVNDKAHKLLDISRESECILGHFKDFRVFFWDLKVY